MMFAIDAERLNLLFTIDDRDLALAFAAMEGYAIRRWGDRLLRAKPLPPRFGYGGTHDAHDSDYQGTAPTQIRPGVFAYRITRTGHTHPLGRTDEALLGLVRAKPAQRAADYAAILDVPTNEVATMLVRLRKRKLVEARRRRKSHGGDQATVWAPAGWEDRTPPASGVRQPRRFSGQRGQRGQPCDEVTATTTTR